MSLTTGAIGQIIQNQAVQAPILRILSRKEGNRVTTRLTDGTQQTIPGFFEGNGLEKVQPNVIVRLDSYTRHEKKDQVFVRVSGFTVMQQNQQQQQQQQPSQQQQQQPQIRQQATNNNNNNTISVPRSATTVNTHDQMVIHPINSLNPYNRRWTIKGKVTFKSELKTWENQKGAGKLFSVNVLDKDGGEIKITCFGDAADQFFNVFEKGNVYLISKGSLKPANKAYTSLKNPYEITLDANSYVAMSEPDPDIPQVSFNFVEIASLRDINDDVVDIIGVIHELSSPTTIHTKSGKDLDKRSIVVCDKTMTKIEVTLWGEFSQMDLGSEDHPVLACKGLKLGDFGGRSLSTNFNGTEIILNPPLQNTEALRSWYDNLTPEDHLRFVALTDKSKFSGNTTSSEPSIPVLLGQLKGMVLRDASLTSRTFSARGFISGIKHEMSSDNNAKHPMFYRCCPTPDCLKGVEDDSTGTYTCTKCKTSFQTHSYAYMVSFSVADLSGQCWATAFKTAENFLKIPAKDMYALSEQDPDRFAELIYESCYRPVNLKLKTQYTTYDDKPVVRVNADRVDLIDYSQGSRDLLSQIHGMLNQE